ncbi:MAG: hypothetical protein M3Y29_02965, partial [Chloroflexota bacterium]|nr:hypothetical protein [Chloroflexota bacterium]
MDVRLGPVRPHRRARAVDAALVVVGVLSVLLVMMTAAVDAATPGADPVGVWATVAVAGVFIGAGLVAGARRPHNRCGLLMIGAGIAFAVAGLQGVSNAPLDALGLLVETLPLAMTLHLLMAYPSGRLGSRPARVLVVAGYIVALALQLPRVLFAAEPNLLRIAPSPAADTVSTVLQIVTGVGLLIAAGVVLNRRARSATAAVRRAIGPLRWYGPLALAVAAAAALAGDVLTDVPWPALTAWLQLAALAGLPLVFLAGLITRSFGRAGELRELLAGLDRAPLGADELEHLLGDALGDESLRMLYAHEPGYVDGGGSPAPAPGRDGRGLAAVSLGDDVVGLLEYDTTLIADTTLVDEVARIVALAVERQRMAVELR